MVVIRLSRSGAKKRPFYQMVVADKRSPIKGRFIERIGRFNPIARGAEVPLVIKLDRFDYWVSVGAQPSDRVTSLVKKLKRAEAGLPEKPKRKKKVAAPAKEQTTKTEEAAPEATSEKTATDSE